MSLSNNLVRDPIINTNLRKEYIVDYTEINDGGAFTTLDIKLDTFPAGAIIYGSRLWYTVALVGTSVSAATARLKLVTQAASPITTSLGSHALDVFSAVGVLDETSSVSSPSSTGFTGTFVANGASAVTVSNTNVAITDTIAISLNTVGGTVGVQPHVSTITAGTGFTVVCTASDTSTYNYTIVRSGSSITVGDLEKANDLYMTITTTGANLSVVTAGEIHAVVNYAVVA